ncbi:MAG: hypothetical protein AAF567_10515 [Actinomycetota bacterium]
MSETRVTAGDISDELMAKSVWSDQDIDAHGIPRWTIPFCSVGGGLGSFTMVDTLRVAGVPTDQMLVLSDIDVPSETYEHLANNSQIPRHERLRSDSGSVLDCIWGWPGYAMREGWAKKAPYRWFQVATEPILAEYFTPQAGQVYESVGREAARINWHSMLHKGVVRTVRKRAGGDYFVLFTPEPGSHPTKRIAVQAKFVHIAVGYPGVKMLGDLQKYRTTYNDYQRVINAYEPHLHAYEEMLRRPTTVVVRGSGIVASRVLQRMIDDRDKNGAQTKIIHLFRNYPDGWQGDKITFRRPAKRGWAYQAFNYPKSAWGGQLRDTLLKLEGDERSAFIDLTGGTNTAPRKDWQEQLERGLREGFYTQTRGTVADVVPAENGRGTVTTVKTSDGHELTLDADFIIDATGLEANIEEHRVLNDLLEHGGAGKNPKGRLDVERHFEVRGTGSGAGRLYASGSITLGGYYAGVDSFLGLQYAALQIHDALADHGFCKKIGPMRSASQWWKWARNKQI